MKAKLFDGNTFYMLTPGAKIETVPSDRVLVKFVNGRPVYYHQDPKYKNFHIVQARNIKRATNLFMVEKKMF